MAAISSRIARSDLREFVVSQCVFSSMVDSSVADYRSAEFASKSFLYYVVPRFDVNTAENEPLQVEIPDRAYYSYLAQMSSVVCLVLKIFVC